MIAAAVRLWLKVMDPTALTARETLQRFLGYDGRVLDVARSEIWGFRWEGDADPRGVLDRLVRETNLIRNPNKHRTEIVVGDERLGPRGNVWVLVAVPGTGEDLAETLARHRLVGGEIPRTARGTLWELQLDPGGAELGPLAEEIAVVRSHERGLLANPQVEDAIVFTEPPSALELAGRLAWKERGRAG
jgi:hypothetical protein